MKFILDLSCYPSGAVGPGCGSQEDWGRQDTSRHLGGGAASLKGAGKEDALHEPCSDSAPIAPNFNYRQALLSKFKTCTARGLFLDKPFAT